MVRTIDLMPGSPSFSARITSVPPREETRGAVRRKGAGRLAEIIERRDIDHQANPICCLTAAKPAS